MTQVKTENKENNQPSHIVYRVDGQGNQARWQRVGVLFSNKSGGFTQFLHSLDKDLRFVIQENDLNK